MSQRARASVIVPGTQGVLLVHTDGLLMLPGGGIEAGELPIAAAARELWEETTLQAQALQFAFNHPSTHNFHHVFVATQVLGDARPQDDAAALSLLALADIQQGRFPELTSGATRRILLAWASSWAV